jgi:hypothetical protein
MVTNIDRGALDPKGAKALRAVTEKILNPNAE